MRVLGNLAWLVLFGWWTAIAFVLAGLANCLTIVGIPFGIQAFKLAGFALWPFGQVVVESPAASPALSVLGNLLWLILGGLVLAVAYAVVGVLLCCTIVGIPFGVVTLRMAALALLPFGKTVVPGDQVPPGAAVFVGVPR